MFNQETFSLLEQLKLHKKQISLLHEIEKDRAFSDQEIGISIVKLLVCDAPQVQTNYR